MEADRKIINIDLALRDRSRVEQLLTLLEEHGYNVHELRARLKTLEARELLSEEQHVVDLKAIHAAMLEYSDLVKQLEEMFIAEGIELPPEPEANG